MKAVRVRIDQELTFREAAKALGRKHDPEGRKLRNLVEQRERRTGKLIAIRGESGRQWKVTLSALYRAIPECQPARIDYLATSLRELLERVDDHTANVARKMLEEEQVLQRMKRLESRLRTMEAVLRGIAEKSTELDRSRR